MEEGMHGVVTGNSQDAVHTLKTILNKYPSAASEVGHEGQLPLHLACKESSHLDVVKMLVKAWPEAVLCTDDGGNLPLHCACSNKTSATLAIVQYIYKLFPEAAGRMGMNQEYPVLKACANSGSSDVVKFITRCSSEEVLTARDADGDSVLHAACTNKDPHVAAEIVDFLFMESTTVFVSGSSRPQYYNNDNSLPIHTAAGNASSLKVVESCIKAFSPACLEMRNDYGETPLHAAGWNQNPVAHAIAHELCHRNPDVLTFTDRNGALPIHAASENTPYLGVFETFLDMNPSTLHREDDQGCNVLHAVCCNQTDAATSIIRRILRTESKLLELQQDKSGRYPVHLGAEYLSDVNTVMELFRLYSRHKASPCLDEASGSVLHYGCRNETENGDAIVMALLAEDPSLCKLVQLGNSMYANMTNENARMTAAGLYSEKPNADPDVLENILRAWPEAVWEIQCNLDGSEKRMVGNIRARAPEILDVLMLARKAVGKIWSGHWCPEPNIHRWVSPATRYIVRLLLLAQGRSSRSSGSRSSEFLSSLPKDVMLRICQWTVRACTETPVYLPNGMMIDMLVAKVDVRKMIEGLAHGDDPAAGWSRSVQVLLHPQGVNIVNVHDDSDD